MFELIGVVWSIIRPYPPAWAWDKNWYMTAAFALAEGGVFLAMLVVQVRFWLNVRGMSAFLVPRLSPGDGRMSKVEVEALARDCADGAPAFAEALVDHANGFMSSQPPFASGSFLDVADGARIREHYDRGAWISANLAAAGPGLMTAFGILGTFVGLVAGLPDAGQLDDAAIGTLISGLQTSFRTSIWGLLGSMFLTVLNQGVDGQATVLCAQVGRWVDSKVPPMSEARLLGDILRRQADAASSLKTLNTDLSQAIERSLNQALNQTLSPALNAMAANAKEMAEISRASSQVTTSAQVDGIHKIIDKVVQGLDEAIGVNLRTAGAELQRFAETQTGMLDKWHVTASRLNDTATSVAALSERQKTAAETLLQALQMADGSGRALAAPAGNLLTAITTLQKTTTDLQQVSERVARLAAELQQASSRTSTMLTEWDKATGAVRQVTTDLTVGMNGFAKQFPGAIQTVMVSFDKELGRGVTQIAASTRALQDAIDDLVDHLNTTLPRPPGGPPTTTPAVPRAGGR